MDMILPWAPVRSTGPATRATQWRGSSACTLATGVSAIKHRSAEPSVGRWALGVYSVPFLVQVYFLLTEVECLAPVS
jgi:hypothetical protein